MTNSQQNPCDSRYLATLPKETLVQMAEQLMQEDPDSAYLEQITDELELRHIRAERPLISLEEAADKLTRLIHPEFTPEEHAAQVQRTLAVLRRHAGDEE